MKTSKLIVAGSLLLSIAAFTGCQNCDEAVRNAQTAADGRVTSITDSLQGAWRTDVEAVRAGYDAQLKTLQDSLTSVTAKLEAKSSKSTTPKKTTTTTPKTTTEDQKPKVTPR